MFIHEGRVLNLFVPMILNDIQYPGGWFLDPEARAAAGILEIPDPAAPPAPPGKESVLTRFDHAEDGTWSPVWDTRDVAAPVAPIVPEQVSRRQARQALLLAGLLDQVPAKIATIEDPVKRGLALIEWEDSQVFERNRPLLLELGGAIGLDAAGLDKLFIEAGNL